MEELEEELKKVDLITLLRTFKKEGLDNFIVIRKEKLENNFIPKLKVKEKIEEINKAYEDSKDENGESQYYYPDYTIRVLEELLEKRK